MIASRELIDSFREYALSRLSNGGPPVTIDELYSAWRNEREYEETVRDVKRGLEQLERGEGMSLEELKEQLNHRLRRHHEVL